MTEEHPHKRHTTLFVPIKKERDKVSHDPRRPTFAVLTKCECPPPGKPSTKSYFYGSN